jgi:hypothetical protein
LIYLDKPWLHDFSAVRIFFASVRLRTPLPEWNQPEAFGTTLLRCRGAVADTPVADAPIRDPFGGYADRKCVEEVPGDFDPREGAAGGAAERQRKPLVNRVAGTDHDRRMRPTLCTDRNCRTMTTSLPTSILTAQSKGRRSSATMSATGARPSDPTSAGRLGAWYKAAC